MYCDLLQDAGACETAWRRALRIAQSLQTNPNLYLLGVYGGRAHPVFNRPSQFASIFYSWLRPEWAFSEQSQSAYAPWQGTFFAYGSPEMSDVVMNIVSTKKCVRQFFLVHSMRKFKPRTLFNSKF